MVRRSFQPTYRRIAASWAVAASLTLGACASSGNRQATRSPFFGVKGVPWSILCLELKGEYRRSHIEAVAKTLRATDGIAPKQVIVSHDADGFSRLYHGQYIRSKNTKTGKRAIPKKMASDLRLIKELAAGPGQHLFIGATMVPSPRPDVGNPDWALTGTGATYSLQVAVFEPVDDAWEFKQAAADHCALLRERGFEAYHHHSRASSLVTVGSFGPEAVIDRPRGLPRYSREVLSLQTRDNLLRFNLLNGEVYRARNDAGEMVRVQSRLVRVPKPGEESVWGSSR